MRIKTIILFFLLISLFGHSQNDTINQRDENDMKHGHWIYYGKDRLESGYPENGKVEEGSYLHGSKEGLWIKYHMDGITPKLKAEYHNNRPQGHYWKGDLGGVVIDSGFFDPNNYDSKLVRRGGSVDRGFQRDTLVVQNDTIVNQESPPLDTAKIRGCVTGTWFKENGFNKIYNLNDEIWQEGDFRNGRLWDGKVYEYDSDGILFKVKVFKNGVYHSDGQL